MADASENDKQKDFLRLYSADASALHAHVWCLCPNEDEAGELFQELSYRLWTHFEQYDRSREFLPWARGVARNLVLEHYRRKKRSRSMSEHTLDQIAALSEDLDDEATERRNALRLCIQKLAQNDRDLLHLRYENQVKPKDIATKSGRHIRQVYRWLARIHADLLTCIRRVVAEGIMP